MHRRIRLLCTVLFMCLGFLSLAGCESSGSMVVYGTGYLATEPTVVIVRPVAVSIAEAQRDADVLPGWVLGNPRPSFQTNDDVSFGEKASQLLAKELLHELTIRGIPAVMSDGKRPPHNATIITGQFVDLDSGTKWLRPEIGYSLRNGYEARVQVTQHGNLACELSLYSRSDGVQGARDLASQIAHQIHASYVLGGWGPAKAQ